MGKRTVAVSFALGALLAACSRSPIAPSASTITVTGTVPAVGQTSQLAAKAALSNGTSQDVTATAAWSSSNAAVATVTAGGLLKILQPGGATITATYLGATGTLLVSFSVASVTISGTTSVFNGLTSQLTAKATLSSGTVQDVTTQAAWVSSNSVVAAVSPAGLVSGKGLGAANVVATYQGVTGTASLSVAPFVLSPSTPLTMTFRTSPNTADLLAFALDSSGNSYSATGTLTAQLFDGGSLLGTISQTATSPGAVQGGFSFLFESLAYPFTTPPGAIGFWGVNCCTRTDFGSINSGSIVGKLVFSVSGGSVLNMYPTPGGACTSFGGSQPEFYLAHSVTGAMSTTDAAGCTLTDLVVTGVFAGASQPSSASLTGRRQW